MFDDNSNPEQTEAAVAAANQRAAALEKRLTDAERQQHRILIREARLSEQVEAIADSLQRECKHAALLTACERLNKREPFTRLDEKEDPNQ